jgi:GNAT superfamily N-acetyltransferase
MSGYRFCRTDDIPLLVEAYNACCGDRRQTEPPLTVDGFKYGARELGLWASSCMIAFDGEAPIAVLLGAKREDSNLVYRLAVRPGHERRGHGRHLLDSLRRKVAILGPRRLVVEVPAESTGVCRFFERCGFATERRYGDFVSDRTPAAFPLAASLVSAVTVEELVQSGALDPSIPRPWERSLATMVSRSREIDGLAIASDERIEAYVLHRASSGACELVALGAARNELLAPLLADLHRRGGMTPRIRKVAEDEIPEALLAALGFRRETEYIGYAANMRAP